MTSTQTLKQSLCQARGKGNHLTKRQSLGRSRGKLFPVCKHILLAHTSAMWKNIVFSLVMISVSGSSIASEESRTAQLIEFAKQWVATDQGIDASEIEITPPDRRATLDTCASDPDFAWAFTSSTRTLEVSCQNPSWRYFLQVRFDSGVAAIAAKGDLLRGHVLNREDLIEIRIRDATDDHITAPEDLIGQTLSRDIAKGDAIKRQDVAVDEMQFTTLRSYQRGEPIEYEDLFFERTSRPRAGSLTEWPRGHVIAQRDINVDTLLRPSDIESAVAVLVTTENVVRNQVITDAMVTSSIRPTRQIRSTPLTQPKEAIGFEATRTLRVGTILTASDLRAADLIRKGENVTLTISRGALSISVDTIALEDAKLGEQVRLQNSDSGKEIRGIVVGRHRAEGL